MRWTKLIVLAFVLSWLSACSESSVEPAVNTERAILEAAVRYEITSIDTAFVEFFTLAVMTDVTAGELSRAELHAPPSWLVDRLRAVPLPYRAYEQCAIGVGGVSHADFAGAGWLVWTASVTITGNASAIVYAGYFFAGLGAKGELLQLKREDGFWRVWRASTMWIS
ncbi:MAG: hypothetical protein M5R41_08255 [Bacteroidia bacterium]|nr:hypothetical protein [Bacteroidia bacterium]